MKDYLKYLPGFRSDTTWKKVLAAIYYLSSLTMIFDSFWTFVAAIALPFMVFGFVDLIKSRKEIKTNPKIILPFVAALLIFSVAGNAMPPAESSDNQAIESEQNELTEEEKQTEALEKEKQEEAKKQLEAKEKEEKRLEEEKQAEFAKNFTKAKVTKHVDGDTVHVTTDDGEVLKIRMIGVDTPETVHPSKPVEFYGQEASNFTKDKIFEETVYLEKDVSETDKYDRALRYIWLEIPEEKDFDNKEVIKNKMFNAMLVAKGYANSSTYQPDVKYQELFTELESEAREADLGLWDAEKLAEYERKEEQVKQEAQVKKEEEARKKEQAAKEKKQQEAAAAQQSNNSGGGQGTAPAPAKQETPTPPEPDVKMVLVTPTGKRYHSRVCGNGNFTEATLEHAKSRGLTPCKKCY